MRMQLVSKQSGISFLGLVFVAVVLACVGVVAAQVAPTVIEYFAIEKAVNKAAREGADLSVPEVRAIFDKASAIDDFKSLTSKDLEITKINDKLIVKFAYQNEIHLVGPAYLTLKYEGQSK